MNAIRKPLTPTELTRIYRGPGVHDADRKEVRLAAFMRIFTLAEQVHNITGDTAQSQPAAAVPDGWVLVPREVTPEMLRAAQLRTELGAYACARLAGAYDLLCELFAAMAAAAPQAPQQAEPWRPIETAPKDAVVLLAAEFDCPGDWRIKCGTWIPDEKAWRVWGASWIPTRWMPLPAPPATPVA